VGVIEQLLLGCQALPAKGNEVGRVGVYVAIA